MKSLIFLLVIFLQVFKLNSQSITDVIMCDTLTYIEIIAMIENDNGNIFKNSSESEQKRYNRWRAFYDNRVNNGEDIISYYLSMIDYLQGRNKNKSDMTIKPQWELLGPFDTPTSKSRIGQVSSIAVDPSDPNTVFIGGSGGGIWRTHNAMAINPEDVVWQCISDGFFSLGVTKIAIDPNNSDNVYCVNGLRVCGLIEDLNEYSTGIYKSTDGGETWIQLDAFLPEEMVFVNNIVFDPFNANTIYVLSDYSLYKSTDAGISWDIIFNIIPESNKYFRDIIFPNNSTIYLAGSNLLYKFSNNLWTDIKGNLLPTSDDYVISIDYNTQDFYIYALYCSYDIEINPPCNGNPNYRSGKLYKSSDGISWNSVGETGCICATYCLRLKVAPNGNIFAGGVRIQKLSYGASNFQNLQTTPPHVIHDDTRDIDFGNANDDVITFMGTDGGVVRNTTGSTSNWESINGNLALNQFYSIAYSEQNPEVLLGGTTDCGTFKRDASGDWYHLYGGDGGSTIIDYYDQNNMFTMCNNWIKKSTNGLTFNGIGLELPVYDSPIIQNQTNCSTFYAGEYHIKKSENYFTTWNNFGPDDCGRITAIANSKTNSQEIIYSQYMGYNQTPPGCQIQGSIWKTVDNGQSWEDMRNNPGLDINVDLAPVSDIEISYTDPDKIWLVFSRFIDGKKIYYSDDGGDNWENISYNLPNIPVNTIVYDESSEGCFLGTDFGLWYLADNTTNWELFDFDNTGLPETIINDLKLVRSTGELIVGTYSRGIYRADVQCGIYLPDPIIINTNTTWDSRKKLFSDLIIENNAELTIKSNLLLQKDVKITVKKGSRLILDGAYLTNRCSDLWQGIIVEGASDQSQIPMSNQGYVKMLNGAVIENAVTGISSMNGGIVRTSGDCRFVNCIRAIEIKDYPDYNNISEIEDCVFEINDSWIDFETEPESFIYLSDVKHVKILDSEFSNASMLENMPWGHRGIGIRSIDANYLAWSQGSAQTEIFTGLDYGIYSQATNPVIAITCINVLFDNNWDGIYLSGIERPIINLNQFNIPDGGIRVYCIGQICHGNTYGLYLDNCTGYQVEENIFYSEELEDHITTGLVINNSGRDPNLIYKNTFTNITYPAIAQYWNRNIYGDGLEFRCNIFENCGRYDIAVAGDDTNQGIADNQGSGIEPAGNLFSHPCDQQNLDLFNNVAGFQYFYNDNPSNAYPECRNGNINVFLTQNTNGCESLLGGEGEPDPRKEEMAEKSLQIIQLASQIQTVEDGGNTTELENQVFSTLPSEALQLRNELLDKSPYLSDTVMVTSVNIENVLLPVMLKDILVANPQSAKSDTVMKCLEQRVNPLPEYMIGEIEQGRNILSPLEIMENQLHSNKQIRQRLLNEVVSFYFNDTVPASADSLIALLGNEQSPESKYTLISNYVLQNNLTSAQQILISIPSSFELTEKQQIEYDKYYSLFNVQISLLQDTLTYYEMDSLQELTIRMLAEDYNYRTGALARNIISMIDTTKYEEIVLLPEPENGNKSEPDQIKVPALSRLILFPNPSKNFFVAEYSISEKSYKTAGLQLTDAVGRLVLEMPVTRQENQVLIETFSLKSCIYMCSLVIDGKNIENKSIVIEKQ